MSCVMSCHPLRPDARHLFFMMGQELSPDIIVVLLLLFLLLLGEMSFRQDAKLLYFMMRQGLHVGGIIVASVAVATIS